MAQKMVCDHCHKKYDPDVVKNEFNMYFASSGDNIDYDEYIAWDLCLDCAIREYNEGIGAYSAMAEYLEDD